MTIAMIAFIFGVLVGLFSGFRLFVRMYQEMQFRGRAYDSGIIRNIQLRDTTWLEIVGLICGLVLVQIAIRFMR